MGYFIQQCTHWFRCKMEIGECIQLREKGSHHGPHYMVFRWFLLWMAIIPSHFLCFTLLNVLLVTSNNAM